MPRSAPRANLAGDLYNTDALQLVVLVSDEIVPLSGVEFLNWEQPQPKLGSEMPPGRVPFLCCGLFEHLTL